MKEKKELCVVFFGVQSFTVSAQKTKVLPPAILYLLLC